MLGTVDDGGVNFRSNFGSLSVGSCGCRKPLERGPNELLDGLLELLELLLLLVELALADIALLLCETEVALLAPRTAGGVIPIVSPPVLVCRSSPPGASPPLPTVAGGL